MFQNDNSHNNIFSQLKLVIVPGRISSPKIREHRKELYSFWKKNWSQTFNEINIKFNGESDDFCRQFEVLGIMHDTKVVGCVLIDVFDIHDFTNSHHSYFNKFSNETILNMQNTIKEDLVFTLNYLTVDSEYRKHLIFPDILVGLVIKRMYESNLSTIITYTRNTRRTNKLAYRFGAKTIQSNLSVNGEPSDFVFFDRSSYQYVIQHQSAQLIESLWTRRIHGSHLLNKETRNQGGFINETVQL